MENENTNENKKKQKVVLLIGLVTLLIAVLGATYAYFQIGTETDSSNTNITGSTPDKSLVTLKDVTSKLHLNISASDMSLANATNEYYATEAAEKSYEDNESDGTKTIAEVKLTGGEATTKYSCTAKLTVSKVTDPEEEADTMVEVLQPGDMILQFKGNIISEKLDLSELNPDGSKEYDLSFKVTGNKVENIQAYIKLINKETQQNYLAGHKLNIDINTSDLKCNVYIEHPTIAKLRENDENNALSENIVGDMYRYQGNKTDVINNYICFGTNNKEECANAATGYDKYMYRIIGITEEGQLKLIKYTNVKRTSTSSAIGWDIPGDLEYDEDGSYSEWPESSLFKRLNGLSNGSDTGCSCEREGGNSNIFINSYTNEYPYMNTSSPWLSMIEDHEWLYGDENRYLSAEESFKVETGIEDAHHYILGSDGSKIEESYSWKNNKVEAKIGLLYIHDLKFSYNGMCDADASYYCSWLWKSENWLLTRIGLSNFSNTYYGWYMRRAEEMIDDCNLEYDISASPVFYLLSTTKISSGTGSISDPYILEIKNN